MTSSFTMGSHQATLEEDVTLFDGQTFSSLTGRTSGLPQGQLSNQPFSLSATSPAMRIGVENECLTRHRHFRDGYLLRTYPNREIADITQRCLRHPQVARNYPRLPGIRRLTHVVTGF